jgi:hypothetical protein
MNEWKHLAKFGEMQFVLLLEQTEHKEQKYTPQSQQYKAENINNQ